MLSFVFPLLYNNAIDLNNANRFNSFTSKDKHNIIQSHKKIFTHALMLTEKTVSAKIVTKLTQRERRFRHINECDLLKHSSGTYTFLV